MRAANEGIEQQAPTGGPKFHPFSPSDQNVISPNNLNTLSTRQVMRIKKIINKVKLFDVTPNSLNQLEIMYGSQSGESTFRSWECQTEKEVGVNRL